jgi:hypothetical protein
MKVSFALLRAAGLVLKAVKEEKMIWTIKKKAGKRMRI